MPEGEKVIVTFGSSGRTAEMYELERGAQNSVRVIREDGTGERWVPGHWVKKGPQPEGEL